jgi:hypothetical protein
MAASGPLAGLLPDRSPGRVGRAGERPVPPLNLVGDFGGGSMLLVTGMLPSGWWADERGANLLDGPAPFTTPTPAPTAVTSPSARSSRSFTARSWTASGSVRTSFPIGSTGRAGRS